MAGPPVTIDFPETLRAERSGKDTWTMEVDGVELRLSNLTKPYWVPEGYTKADLIAYYANVARVIVPALAHRPMTMRRMPDGADGGFFYAKQAPEHVPEWMPRATVETLGDPSGRWGSARATAPTRAAREITYLLVTDTASLLYLANLGCIEMHPWHSRVDAIGRPDYAFFDLDPAGVGFDVVRSVALVIRTALDQLGLRSYPKTSGARGLHVYVPIERVHSADQVREFVTRVCQLVHRADPERTTLEPLVENRHGVYLDALMNTEGRNIVAAYSVRPRRGATVSTPLTWDELAGDVEPGDLRMATLPARLTAVGDLWGPVTAGGQDLRAAMEAVGVDPGAGPNPAGHVVHPGTHLETYRAKRNFGVTTEPRGDAPAPATEHARFVVQHHLATRLHHDLRLERGGTLRSWAVPKGLPDVPNLPHLAVQTEDHPLEYLTFSGDIPPGEYGAGPMRIWDTGTYEAVEWTDRKVTFRLHGHRHRGEWHLFKPSGRGDDQWLVVRARAPAPLPPEPPALTPMLAATGEGPFDGEGWLFEVKWDGIRALATTRRPGMGPDAVTILASRNGNDVSAAYPELADLWQRVLARNAVLDGEIVVLGADGRPSFARLQQRMHLRDPARIERLRARTPVTYVVFDLLVVEGQPLLDTPLTDRLELLDDLLIPGPRAVRSEVVVGRGRALYDAAAAQGLEGIVAKRADSLYTPGRRSDAWRKIKVRRAGEVVIGGWLHTTTGGGDLGAVVVGAHTADGLRCVGRVGTGWDTAERERLRERLEALSTAGSPFVEDPGIVAQWVEPRLVCAVEFAEVTDEDRLRAPSYRGIVEGADPRDVTLETLLNAHERAARASG